MWKISCHRVLVGSALSVLIVASVFMTGRGLAQEEAAFDPPEQTIGERLFLETRFAQFFNAFLHSGGQVNASLPAGDPVMAQTVTTASPLSGPFAGQSMNCRACHLVDEHVGTPGGGMRTYADFARRSPVPARADGKTQTSRNSPPLVNASLPRPEGLLLHFDAEFATSADLVKATLTGRNYGWLPREAPAAIVHIARVIREDNGQGALAQDFGGLPYRVVLTGTDASIPPELLLPEAFRINVAAAGDEELVAAVSRLIAAYVEGLEFARDEKGRFNLSPFDVFLEKNGLPREPGPRESPLDYSRRLLRLIEQLDGQGHLSWVNESHRKRHQPPHHRRPKFVRGNPHTDDGRFQFHDQPFRFGREELEGFKIFFAEPGRRPLRPQDLERGKIGNCIACHQAPNFTDFRFHNTGTAQAEYDRIHGQGTFAQLHIPDLAERAAHHDQYLPATASHPDAQEPFRSVPSAANPQLTDLGLWNVFGNPDFPEPQRRIRRILCEDETESRFPGLTEFPSLQHLNRLLDQLLSHGPLARRCSVGNLLPRSVALFKTPGLRDLGHSGPYMHTGQFDTLEDIVGFYSGAAELTRGGHLRNGDAALRGIAIADQDVGPLAAFLRAINEDYE
jgi:hypothetical protein